MSEAVVIPPSDMPLCKKGVYRVFTPSEVADPEEYCDVYTVTEYEVPLHQPTAARDFDFNARCFNSEGFCTYRLEFRASLDPSPGIGVHIAAEPKITSPECKQDPPKCAIFKMVELSRPGNDLCMFFDTTGDSVRVTMPYGRDFPNIHLNEWIISLKYV